MQNTQNHVDHNAIATRAYELYVARGREPGHDEEDWLRAEAELRQTTQAPVQQPKVVKPTSKKGNGRK